MTLRKFNNILSVIVALLALYLLASPLYGEGLYWLKHKTSPHAGFVYKSQAASATVNKQLKSIPDDNRLVIPAIGLNEHIYEGKSPYTLSKGIWHMPGSGDPLASNMVLLGHRFTYRGPAVLFSLDKVKTGDPISIYWQHTEHVYKIQSVSVTSPFDVSVVAPSDTPELTIYTCTPLWTSNQRLVIRAMPEVTTP